MQRERAPEDGAEIRRCTAKSRTTGDLQELGEGMEQVLADSAEGKGPAHLWLWGFCPLELRENGFLFIVSPPVCSSLAEEPQSLTISFIFYPLPQLC